MLSLLFLLPFCAIPFGLILPSSLELPLLPILMVFGLIGVGAWFVLNFFRCPRCDRFFAMTWWYNLNASIAV